MFGLLQSWYSVLFFLRFSPVPFRFFSLSIAYLYECDTEEEEREDKSKYHFARRWILINGERKYEHKSRVHESHEPSLPGRRSPAPTVEFFLEPEFLWIIIDVVAVFLKHSVNMRNRIDRSWLLCAILIIELISCSQIFALSKTRCSAVNSCSRNGTFSR